MPGHQFPGGDTFTHPGQGNAEIVKPAGPIDPEVGVIGAWTKGGSMAGVVVNYACHATTSPGGISANWVYQLERTIRGVFGEQVVVVFLQGACGDITQVDNLNPYAQPNGEESAWIVGGRVGAEWVKVLLSMPRGALAPVDSAGSTSPNWSCGSPLVNAAKWRGNETSSPLLTWAGSG